MTDYFRDLHLAAFPASVTHRELAEARRLAVKRHRGGSLTKAEQDKVNRAVEAVSPENFYMDGELFAG
jgi:hypothetical protein